MQYFSVTYFDAVQSNNRTKEKETLRPYLAPAFICGADICAYHHLFTSSAVFPCITNEKFNMR